MKFCPNCGKELGDEAIICPKCGCEQGKKTRAKIKVRTRKNADGRNGWALFGFLMPLEGIFLYFISGKKDSNVAKQAGCGALLWLILFILLVIFALCKF